MKLIKLDVTGHTEVECNVDQMIAELEKEMNAGRKVAVAKEPGKDPIYVRRPFQVMGLHPDTEVTVMPQIAGG